MSQPTGAAAQGNPSGGIDVSSYQPTVDWQALKAGGYTFAFIKASEGTGVDATFQTHFAGAKTAGILRSAYHFFHPELDAVAQAQVFLGQLADPGDLPPALDVEELNDVPLAQAAAGISAWVDYVTAKLARPIVYTSPSFWNALPLITAIGGKADLWVAQWTAADPEQVSGWDGWAFWQYSDTAVVPGVPDAVDADRFNGSAAELAQYSASFVASIAPGGPPTFDLFATIGVQQALNYLAIASPPLTDDGLPGPLTTAAIKKFQTSVGIAVDGVVGPQTRMSMRTAIAGSRPPATV
jgi:lysozyme